MEQVKKLQSLQGLRALATIGIFLFHSGFLLQGTFPVTLFFMLSGFMMYYTKHDLDDYEDFFSWNKLYVWKKIKQFYPLHFLTFIMACIIGRVWLKPLKETIIGGVLNLLLINSFVPDYALVFNGVSWFLGITIFLYLIAFFLLKLTKRAHNTKQHIMITLVVITAINLYHRFFQPLYLYTNPLYRILDFWLGILIAKLYMESDHDIKDANAMEYGLIVVFIIQYFAGLFLKPNPGYYSILFTAAIYTFAIGKGRISQLLSLQTLDRIAGISFEFYMIHELALRIFRKVFAGAVVSYPVLLCIISFPALFMTIGLIAIYKIVLRSFAGSSPNRSIE